MLKLTVSPGEFVMIGNEIRIIFGGGDRSRIPIAIEAPRELDIIRNTAVKKRGFEGIEEQPRPYCESPLSEEAKRQITAIVQKDRREARRREQTCRKEQACRSEQAHQSEQARREAE